MGKYCGTIGYGESKETVPGVWKMEITERTVYGDVFRDSRRLEKNENLNDNISVATKISFLADPYANQNFHLIKFASYMGTLWKVVLAEPEFPRLILTLGGVYNDER